MEDVDFIQIDDLVDTLSGGKVVYTDTLQYKVVDVTEFPNEEFQAELHKMLSLDIVPIVIQRGQNVTIISTQRV